MGINLISDGCVGAAAAGGWRVRRGPAELVGESGRVVGLETVAVDPAGVDGGLVGVHDGVASVLLAGAPVVGSARCEGVGEGVLEVVLVEVGAGVTSRWWYQRCRTAGERAGRSRTTIAKQCQAPAQRLHSTTRPGSGGWWPPGLCAQMWITRGRGHSRSFRRCPTCKV